MDQSLVLIFLTCQLCTQAYGQARSMVPMPAAGAGPKAAKDSDCGGVLDGPSGELHYKLHSNVSFGEICVWTIVTPNQEELQIKLTEDGFPANCTGCQTIEIFNTPTFGSGTPSISFHMGGDRMTHNMSGYSIYHIVFSTIEHHPSDLAIGQGFSLHYDADGKNMSMGNGCKIFDQKGKGEGDAIYTPDPSPGDSRGELVTLALIPEHGKRLSVTIHYLHNYNPKLFHFPCIPDHWGGTLLVSEISGVAPPVVRFSACRSTSETTMLDSPIPLVITYYNLNRHSSYRKVNQEGFKISWKMID